MHVEVIPTLIDQFRETFEGEVAKGTWIVDARPGSGVFGAIEGLSHGRAFAAPVEGARSIAAHVEHLRFTLDLTLRRMRGEDPPADWAASFNVPAASPAAWDTLRRELRRAYDALLAFLNEKRNAPVQNWVPINLAGLSAMTAHNAYHLGAIRQIARVVSQTGAAT